MTIAAESLLGRLEGVRRTGDGRWVARCPAHADRAPSLSVRDTGDGRTLVHCFGGCETGDVLAAIGATWTDLYPVRDRTAPGRALRREPVASAADALRCLAHEARLAALLAGDLARGERLSEPDRARLRLAAARLTKAESLCA